MDGHVRSLRLPGAQVRVDLLLVVCTVRARGQEDVDGRAAAPECDRAARPKEEDEFVEPCWFVETKSHCRSRSAAGASRTSLPQEKKTRHTQSAEIVLFASPR